MKKTVKARETYTCPKSGRVYRPGEQYEIETKEPKKAEKKKDVKDASTK